MSPTFSSCARTGAADRPSAHTAANTKVFIQTSRRETGILPRLPALRPSDRVVPPRPQALGLLSGHRRFETTVDLPLTGQVISRAPISNRQAGQIRDAECGGFGDRR